MPCYKPMLAVPYKISHDTKKVQYRFSKELHDVGQLAEVVLLEDGQYHQVKALPCGKCIGCRLDYSREWAVRCTLEMQDHPKDTCWFLTLTYDDEHVPVSYYPLLGLDFWRDQGIKIIGDRVVDKFGYEVDASLIDGIYSPLGRSLTLRPDDLRDFIKRLRRHQEYYYDSQIRFYACGEYGSRTARPHYHMIVYGLQLQPFGYDAWKSVKNGNTVYECKELENIWHHGNVIVGACSYETCGYVARYMLKKKKGHYGAFYKQFNLVPEFTRMSLKPGIGLNYYYDHMLDIYSNDEIFISTEKKGIKVKPPRYFDIRAADQIPDTFDQIRVEREDAAFYSMLAKEEKSGLSISDVLANEQKAREFKTKILQERNVVK